MSWAGLVGAILKLALVFLKYTQEKSLMDAGQDKAIAAMALDVLAATKAGKELRDRIVSMTDPEAEALWKSMIEGNKNA